MNKMLKKWIIVWFLVLLALAIVPEVLPIDPIESDILNSKIRPTSSHWMGTDSIGRDVFTRVGYGMRLSFFISLSVTIISCFIGLCMGLLAGYFGGVVDYICNALIDLALSFPSLLLAVGITVILPPGALSVVLALSLIGWADFARLTRGQVQVLRTSGFVMAAKSLGSSSMRICFSHILPHCLPVLIVAAFMKMGAFLLAEAGLSFLGIGIAPPTPTLGAMVADGRNFIATHPWIPLFPGFCLALMVLFSNFMGEYLQQILDPKSN